LHCVQKYFRTFCNKIYINHSPPLKAYELWLSLVLKSSGLQTTTCGPELASKLRYTDQNRHVNYDMRTRTGMRTTTCGPKLAGEPPRQTDQNRM